MRMFVTGDEVRPRVSSRQSVQLKIIWSANTVQPARQNKATTGLRDRFWKVWWLSLDRVQLRHSSRHPWQWLTVSETCWYLIPKGDEGLILNAADWQSPLLGACSALGGAGLVHAEWRKSLWKPTFVNSRIARHYIFLTLVRPDESGTRGSSSDVCFHVMLAIVQIFKLMKMRSANICRLCWCARLLKMWLSLKVLVNWKSWSESPRREYLFVCGGISFYFLSRQSVTCT